MAIRTASYPERPLGVYYIGASFRPRSEERGGVWVNQSVLDIRGDFNKFKAVLGNIAIPSLTMRG